MPSGTRVPHSTISYNSEEFLREVLDRSYRAHIIQCWIYIKHIGEEGDKDHIHVFVWPNKGIDFMDFSEQFCEYVPGYKKPLRTLEWRVTKRLEDWINYALHDPLYLKLHSPDGRQESKIEYSPDDLVCSENYDIRAAIRRAKVDINKSVAAINHMIDDGVNINAMLENGINPIHIRNLMQVKKMNDTNELRYRIAEIRSSLEHIEHLLSHYYGCHIIYDENGLPYTIADSDGIALELPNNLEESN